MPFIVSIGTAVPQYEITQNAVQEFARSFFAGHVKDFERLLPVFANTQIKTRHFCTPLAWFNEKHSFSEKNALYVENATALGCEAVVSCLTQANVSPPDIDHIVFISTTGLATPSIDVLICNKLGMRSDIVRTPIWGLGCAGGAAGVARGFHIARANPYTRILVVAVELCGLTFQPNNRSKSNIVATSLFADGAAAALIEGDEIVREGSDALLGIVGAASTLWPETTDVMGWKVTDSGLDVIFSRDIPSLVREKLKPEVDRFLKEQAGIEIPDVSHVAAHPGGAKVISAYAETLGIEPLLLEPARDVLRSYGNMSSSTVLFVLERIMKQSLQQGYVLAFALGPGFSCEQSLLRWTLPAK